MASELTRAVGRNIQESTTRGARELMNFAKAEFEAKRFQSGFMAVDHAVIASRTNAEAMVTMRQAYMLDQKVTLGDRLQAAFKNALLRAKRAVESLEVANLAAWHGDHRLAWRALEKSEVLGQVEGLNSAIEVANTADALEMKFGKQAGSVTDKGRFIEQGYDKSYRTIVEDARAIVTALSL